MSWFRRRLMAGVGGVPPTTKDYLKFSILTNGTITVNVGWHLTTSELNYISYSKDSGATWTKLQNTDRSSGMATIGNFNVNAGDILLWKGDAIRLGNGNSDFYTTRFGGTSSFDISGNIMSLLSNDFEEMTTMNYSYQFAFLFSTAKVVNAKNLILPTNTQPQCYFRMFKGVTTLVTTPFLPATSTESQCYYGMFDGASNVNYIKAMHINNSYNNSMSYWVRNVAASGVFVKNIDAEWTKVGIDGVPTGWTTIYYDLSEDKYYTDQTKTQECDDHGNVIN